MNMKDIAQSKTLRGVIIGLVIFIVLALVFQAGVFVGFKKAEFSGRFGDSYSRAFGGPMGSGMMRGFPRDIFAGGHGAAGKIVRINLPTIVVADRDNVEKIITTSDDTSFRSFHNTIKPTDLKVGDFVVVLGSPDSQGQIDAKLVRLLPEPSRFQTGSTTNATSSFSR